MYAYSRSPELRVTGCEQDQERETWEWRLLRIRAEGYNGMYR